MNVEFNPRYVRLREAAELLGVSESTIRTWLYTGALEGIKVNRVARVDLRSIEKLAEAYRYQDAARKAHISALARVLSWRQRNSRTMTG